MVHVYLASYYDVDPDPQQEWIMVEARSSYYEANTPILTTLQKLYSERRVYVLLYIIILN